MPSECNINPAVVDISDEQMDRYARHLTLNGIEFEGQSRFLQSHVLIIGAGGLGCIASLFLAGAGVGSLSLVDDDCVSLSNLQRQVAYRMDDIGKNKALQAQRHIQALNPDVQVHAYPQRADDELLRELIPNVHIVLDCSDNFATRHLVNQFCYHYAKPLVSGSAIGFDGQVCVFDFRVKGHACYNCLFPQTSPSSTLKRPQHSETTNQAASVDQNCTTMGVFSPLVGIIGSMQAARALKILLQPLPTNKTTAELLLYDALHAQSNVVLCEPSDTCAVCASKNHIGL